MPVVHPPVFLVKVINYALKYSNEFIEIESDQTNQIVRYLDQHFLKEIGVEDLARTFHMSKSSLNKFFQKGPSHQECRFLTLSFD